MIPLGNLSDFENYLNRSVQEPGFSFAVFKHSTRCSISHGAFGRMERDWEQAHPGVPVLYLDLLQFRTLSDQIERISGIRHESPQLLVFQSGQCVFSASHFDIQPRNNQW